MIAMRLALWAVVVVLFTLLLDPLLYVHQQLRLSVYTLEKLPLLGVGVEGAPGQPRFAPYEYLQRPPRSQDDTSEPHELLMQSIVSILGNLFGSVLCFWLFLRERRPSREHQMPISSEDWKRHRAAKKSTSSTEDTITRMIHTHTKWITNLFQRKGPTGKGAGFVRKSAAGRNSSAMPPAVDRPSHPDLDAQATSSQGVSNCFGTQTKESGCTAPPRKPPFEKTTDAISVARKLLAHIVIRSAPVTPLPAQHEEDSNASSTRSVDREGGGDETEEPVWFPHLRAIQAREGKREDEPTMMMQLRAYAAWEKEQEERRFMMMDEETIESSALVVGSRSDGGDADVENDIDEDESCPPPAKKQKLGTLVSRPTSRTFVRPRKKHKSRRHV